MTDPDPDPDTAAVTQFPESREPIEVPYQAFRSGLPVGRFRVIVNPERARKYVKHKLLLTFVLLPLIASGAALALVGFAIPGLILVVLGIALHRIVKTQSPKILLHLALRDEKIYREAIEFEILEVRMAG